MPGLISGRWWVSVPFELALIGATSSVASVLSGDVGLDNRLALLAFTAVVLTRVWQQRWSWVGAALFATASLAALAYLAYAAQLTYDNVRGPLYLVASSRSSTTTLPTRRHGASWSRFAMSSGRASSSCTSRTGRATKRGR